ncbi:MAG: hypothetical protein ACJAZY_000409 [Spirosomataceae bacterium]|jgi:hypothetical protein
MYVATFDVGTDQTVALQQPPLRGNEECPTVVLVNQL